MPSRKALLFIAHGSRRPESNEYMTALVDKISAELTNEYESLKLAYLEICQPDIETQIKAIAQTGVDEVHLFPYFLAPGNHVRIDIPEIVENLAPQFPDMTIKLLNYLGNTEAWSDTLVACIRNSIQV